MCQYNKCKDARCSGVYLLHPKELFKIPDIVKCELNKNANRMFILINSDSSGEVFTQFFELHVIDNVSKDEAGKLIDRRYRNEYILSSKSVKINRR